MKPQIFKPNNNLEINSRIRNIQPAFSSKSKQGGYSHIPVYMFIVFLTGLILYALIFIKPSILYIYFMALAISVVVGQLFGATLFLVSKKHEPSGQISVFDMKKQALRASIKKGWYFAVIFFIFLVLQINFNII